jgi:hypothetical protein
MKKTLVKTALLTVLSAASLFALFNLSACTDILGIDTGYTPWCKINFEIKGPDEIFIDPGCKPVEVTYELFADGKVMEPLAGGNAYGLTWNVTGDLSVVSATDPSPLVVVPPLTITEVSGIGFSEISVTGAISSDECGTQGETTTYATKNVSIFANVMVIDSDVCSFGGAPGSGILTMKDKALGDKNYDWEIIPADAATISPTPGTPFCKVTNAIKDFTVRVQKINTDCVIEVFRDVKINCN